MSMSYLMQFFLLIPNISLVLLYCLEKCYREPFFCAISHYFLVFFHLHIIQHLICLSYPLSSLKMLSGKSYLPDFCYRCGAYNFDRVHHFLYKFDKLPRVKLFRINVITTPIGGHYSPTTISTHILNDLCRSCGVQVNHLSVIMWTKSLHFSRS